MKKIGLYDPYFSILGGAEKYILSLAFCLDNQGYEITIWTDQPKLLLQASEKFGINTSHFKTKTWCKNRKKREKDLQEFDTIFYITDGSIFFSPASKNILIIQSPVHIPKKSLVNMFKLRDWKIICYSQYVADFVKKKLNKKADKLFVPVGKPHILGLDKENLIISVGRFFPHLHNKKQKEMVTIFKELLKEGLRGVELYLVGSVDPGGKAYLEEVQTLAKGFPVHIITDLSYVKLQELYAKSKIYWHAAGFGEDLRLHPERAEHFGVSTIEAMVQGTVPIVFAAGGQTEIVTNGLNGFTWITKDELKKCTLDVMHNVSLRQKLATSAISASNHYTQDRFCERLYEILEK